MRARVALALAALTTLLVLLDTVITARYMPLLAEATIAFHGFPFMPLAAWGSAVLGAVVISRDDRHAIGWLLNLLGASGGIALVTESYAVWTLGHAGPGSRTSAGVAGWISSMLGGPLIFTGLALLFLLSPDGRLKAARWRYAVLVTVVGQVLTMISMLGTDPRTFDLLVDASQDGPDRPLKTLGITMISIGLLASLVSMLSRFRCSRGEQRAQLCLIVLAAAAVCGATIWLLATLKINGGQQTWVAQVPFFLSYLLLPVCFTVAVQRYHLYDIEVIVNRTLVVALGTALIAFGYIGLVVGAGKLIDRRTDDLWLSLGATVLVALAFQPLRRTVVRLANRAVFGARAQPYEALSDLGHRLAETPSPQTLLQVVAEATGQAVAARQVTALLDMPDGEALSASWGRRPAGGVHEHVVQVHEGEATLGRIIVTTPRGHPLRPSDVALVAALADHAAVGFRNAAMEARLARHVAELDRATTELAESRSRIVSADDAVRRSLSAAISRDILPHLVTVSQRLQEKSDVQLMHAEDFEELVTQVNAAQASLRELTRGVFPAQLARSGLEPALVSFLGRACDTAVLRVAPSASGRRFTGRVEAAAYFCCTEAIRAGKAVRAVTLAVEQGALVVTVIGIDASSLDRRGISDRAGAVDGVMDIVGDELRLEIPLRATAHPRSPDTGHSPEL